MTMPLEMRSISGIEVPSLHAELIKSALEETCKRQANLVVGKEIAENPLGSNIFLGVGLVTQNRISSGLGFGIIPMACLARDLQRNLGEKGLESQIFVLIADQHGLNERFDPKSGEQIQEVAEAVQDRCKRLFQFLGSPDTEVIKASNPNWPTGNHSYTEMETADILHAHEQLGCGVKIGWQTKRQPKDGRVIRDEKWFDNQARLEDLRLENMSFIRANEWLSLATQINPSTLPKTGRHVESHTIQIPYQGEVTIKSNKDVNISPQNLPLPPYFGEPGFHFGKQINLIDEIEQMPISRPMATRFAEFDSVLKRTLNIREKTGRLVVLQTLIDECAR